MPMIIGELKFAFHEIVLKVCTFISQEQHVSETSQLSPPWSPSPPPSAETSLNESAGMHNRDGASKATLTDDVAGA